MEVEQKAFEEHKSRLMAEFAAEKERQQCEQRQKEHHFDTQREKLLHEKKELAEHLNREYNDKIRMIEKRNQVSVQIMDSQFFQFCKLPASLFCSLKLRRFANSSNRTLQFGNVNRKPRTNCAKWKTRMRFVSSVVWSETSRSIQLWRKSMPKH